VRRKQNHNACLPPFPVAISKTAIGENSFLLTVVDNDLPRPQPGAPLFLQLTDPADSSYREIRRMAEGGDERGSRA
jgi:hypothetical protein